MLMLLLLILTENTCRLKRRRYRWKKLAVSPSRIFRARNCREYPNGRALLAANLYQMLKRHSLIKVNSSSPWMPLSDPHFLKLHTLQIFERRWLHATLTPGLDSRAQKGTSIFFWARNLLNKNYFEQLLPAGGNAGQYAGVPRDPGTYGITVRHAF